jgi:hypothetical protein
MSSVSRRRRIKKSRRRNNRQKEDIGWPGFLPACNYTSYEYGGGIISRRRSRLSTTDGSAPRAVSSAPDFGEPMTQKSSQPLDDRGAFDTARGADC